MNGICLSAALLFLFLIVVEDLRSRAVHWFLLPLSGIAIAGTAHYYFHLDTGWFHIAVNMSFVILQVAVLAAWFFYKGISVPVLLRSYIGAGDLLFFVVLAVALPFPLFPFFFTFSLGISLVAGILFFPRSTVPLAGLQSLLLMVLMASDAFLGTHMLDLQIFFQ